MLDTFIKNKGITKTIIHNNNKNIYNEVNWDADYDGKNANISLDIDQDGTKGHVELKMNNDELAELLNIPSESNMLDKRLYRDFLSKRPEQDYKIIEIQNNKPKSILHNDSYSLLKNEMENNYTHLSSPGPLEELVIPFFVNEHKTRKHKNHKKHKTPRTHITYKVYKKHRRSSSPSSRKSLKKRIRHNRYSQRTF